MESIPKSLARAFAKNKKAKEVFDNLPPSHKREYLEHLNLIQKEETLERNVKKMMEMLLGKK